MISGLPWTSIASFSAASAEVGFHGVRQTPGQDLARRPVDDGDEVEKAPPHRDIGQVGAPDVVGPSNDELPQQIGTRLVERLHERCNLGPDFPQTPLGHHFWRPKGVELSAFRAIASAQNRLYS